MNIRKQLVKRNIAGDVILVPVGDASLEIKGLLTLNETGELLWDALPEAADEAALPEAADEAALTAVLQAEYDVDDATARRDVGDFLAKLRELQVI